MPRTRAPKKSEALRLSDEEIAELLPRYKAAKAAEAKAEKEAKDIAKLVIGELDARKTDSLDVGELRVKKVQGSLIEYDVDKLFEILPTRLFRKVTVRKVDKTLLSAAVQAGDITAKKVAEAAIETKKSPYISIANSTGD